jgi:predicted transcriptional regulator
MPAQKVAFTLPDELVRKLEKVTSGKRSLLMAEALRREFARRATVDALKRLRHRTAWREQDHVKAGMD